jgi:hypothetical protein
MKLTLSAILGASVLAASAFAGPAPVYEKAVIEPECSVPFTGVVTFGYDTDFIYRGFNLGQNNIHAGVDINVPLGGALSLDVGAHYNHPTDDDLIFGGAYDQLDVHGLVNFPLWIFDASFGVIWHGQPTLDNDFQTTDLVLGLSKDVGFATVSALIVRDIDLMEGWYFELGLDKTIALADCLDLNLGAGVSLTSSYGEGIFGVNGLDGGHAVSLSAGLTYHLTSNAALNFYLAGNFALDDLQDATGQGDHFYGGTSLSVSF